jgi:hypothetical protein
MSPLQKGWTAGDDRTGPPATSPPGVLPAAPGGDPARPQRRHPAAPADEEGNKKPLALPLPGARYRPSFTSWLHPPFIPSPSPASGGSGQAYQGGMGKSARPGRNHFCLAQSRAPLTRAGLLACGSSPGQLLPIPTSRDSGFFTGRLPAHSGATAADSHRLPY